MTFFEALKSETHGSKEVDSAFPEALKEPVLRKVQFSTTSRIDHLVDEVYDDFKADFYPGELVTVLMDDSNRLNGIVREKTKFPMILKPDGSIEREAFSRYFVRLVGKRDEEALVDGNHVQRDRKTFTKMMLRSFIKNTVTREAWNGAPWLVKPKVAQEYRIDTSVPPHLQYGNKVAERKAAAAAAKKNDQNGQFQVWTSSRGLPELKPAVKGGKQKHASHEQDIMVEQQYEEYQRALQSNPNFVPPNGHPLNGHFQLNGGAYPTPPHFMPTQQSPAPPAPPPIKYPIEDMDIEPLRDGKERPTFKYMSEDIPVPDRSSEGAGSGIEMQTVGLLLEIWNTLNVYSQVYQLDSFTFDDFVEAMQFRSDDVDCELFVEIHCGVLKLLVKSENDKDGAIQISLPDLPSDDEDEEEDTSAMEESRLPTPTPEPEVPERRTTRSSLAKAEAETVKADTAENSTPESEAVTHRAAEMFSDYGWIERLRKRDFKNGGWQMIMIGLLHQIAGRPRMEDLCTDILTHLAPLDAEPTQETARLQYAAMDINLRVKALQVISMLSIETNSIKNHMEECSALMTQHRKDKIEHQRARKFAMEELRKLHEERKSLAPEKSPTPPPELEAAAEVDATIEDYERAMDTEDEEPLPSRSLRRGNDREAERKRKRDEEEERKKRAEAAKHSKGSKEYLKVLKKIDQEKEKIRQAEEEIAEIDEELRQLDCPRTRVLGKDRFCNRYYWFERNAMSPEGNADSSTADAEYANGRIWIQGPDDLEREGFLDVPKDLENNYANAFGMTPNERKKLEEGPTNVFNAYQWGYYDDPESIDKLIDWLDPRGNRELKLRKELQIQRDLIAKYMAKRKGYVSSSEETEDATTIRMSTRTKTYVSDPNHRCLRWKNDTALAENGHRHYNPPPKPRGKATTKKQKADDGLNAKATNRQGKPLTRQGTRYNF